MMSANISANASQQLGWALKERDNCVRNIAGYTLALADTAVLTDKYREIIALSQRRIPQLDAMIAELRKQHGLDTDSVTADDTSTEGESGV
jgi:hypothetical protein